MIDATKHPSTQWVRERVGCPHTGYLRLNRHHSGVPSVPDIEPYCVMCGPNVPIPERPAPDCSGLHGAKRSAVLLLGDLLTTEVRGTLDSGVWGAILYDRPEDDAVEAVNDVTRRTLEATA